MTDGKDNEEGIEAANNARNEVYRNCPERKKETVALSNEELAYIVAHSPVRLMSA
jgi:hypothetical protein